MTLTFKAEYVDCADAIDGEILQVSFDTIPANQDEEDRCTPFVLISRNFEFPGPAKVSWHDGNDYHGGAGITSISLRKDSISMQLNGDLDFHVAFSLADKKLVELRIFLRKITGDRIPISE